MEKQIFIIVANINCLLDSFCKAYQSEDQDYQHSGLKGAI